MNICRVDIVIKCDNCEETETLPDVVSGVELLEEKHGMFQLEIDKLLVDELIHDMGWQINFEDTYLCCPECEKEFYSD